MGDSVWISQRYYSAPAYSGVRMRGSRIHLQKQKGTVMRETQKDMVLRYLKEHKEGITPKVAYYQFGIMRLADVVYKLKKDKHHIKTTTKKTINKYGAPTEYACYVLED